MNESANLHQLTCEMCDLTGYGTGLVGAKSRRVRSSALDVEEGLRTPLRDC
jgi:hypothetical protein